MSKFIDKLAKRFGYIKPTEKRNFEAADTGRLYSSWNPINVSPDQEIWFSNRRLRARSRDLCLNNDYAKQFIRMVRANVIGPHGIRLQMRVEKPDGSADLLANKIIEDEFTVWARRGNCDVSGQLSWPEFQRLAMEAVAKDGEVLIRMVKKFPNRHGFAVQLIEADYLDDQLNVDMQDGTQIRMGVQLDQWRRPVAYHIKQNPYWSDIPMVQYSGTNYTVLPASEVIHLYQQWRPTQTRGIPWMHSAMTRLKMLGGYEEAELVAARMGAAKMGFFTRGEDGQGYEGEDTDNQGNLLSEAEPGTLEQLPNGVKFQAYDPQHPAGNFMPFMKTCLRGISSGVGIAYNGLANDLEGVNYSSIRTGKIDEWDVWETLQNWFIDAACYRVFENFLDMSMLKGCINLPFSKFDQFNKPHWQGRRWDWVDPLKDMEANKLSIQLGVKSIDEIIRETGRDPEKVFDDIKRSRDRLTELGLEDIIKLTYEPKEAVSSEKPDQ